MTNANAESRLTALKALLRERDVDERLSLTLLDFASTNMVEPCTTQTGQLPLSAVADAYAAVYVNPKDLSIAVDPSVAERAGASLGLRVEQRNPTTWYLHVRPEFLEDETHRPAVTELLHHAFGRAFQGPRWERGLPDRTLVRGAICPTCFLEQPAAGPCPDCN